MFKLFRAYVKIRNLTASDENSCSRHVIIPELIKKRQNTTGHSIQHLQVTRLHSIQHPQVEQLDQTCHPGAVSLYSIQHLQVTFDTAPSGH